MKKYFYFTVFAVLTMLFQTACTNDVSDVTSSDEEVMVTFTLNVADAISSRAISDGKSVNQLMYAIFEGDRCVITKQVVDGLNQLGTNGYTLSISLVKGGKYTGVFWAQNSACEAYKVSDEMILSVGYEGINNDESRDAFYASEDFVVDGSTTKVILKRPFAQVNVGAYEYDWDLAKEYGYTITKSSVIIKNVPNTLNLKDGTVSTISADDQPVNASYSLNNIPTEVLSANLDELGENETYKYLSMCYILAGAEQTLHEMSFVFSGESSSEPTPETPEASSTDKVIEFNKGLSSVPVQRNFRTNILGRILTGTTSVSISVSPAYLDDNNVFEGFRYNFGENTTIANRHFAMNNPSAQANFATNNGETLTFDNVVFSGKIGAITIGEQRGDGTYDNYNNFLNNVTANSIVTGLGIKRKPFVSENVSIAVWLYGYCTLNNCSMTGTKATAEENLAYDLGVTNYATALLNGGTYGSIHAWEHSTVIISENTQVSRIDVAINSESAGNPKGFIPTQDNLGAKYLLIKSGAKVDTVNVISSSLNTVIKIENGAEVGVIITNKDEPYIFDLRNDSGSQQ